VDKFRDISDEARAKRERGERAHWPKTWRHWYYVRSASADQSFLDWINDMLEQVETISDLKMLAVEVRDQFERGRITKDERDSAKNKLLDFERVYDLDILRDVPGF